MPDTGALMPTDETEEVKRRLRRIAKTKVHKGYQINTGLESSDRFLMALIDRAEAGDKEAQERIAAISSPEPQWWSVRV